MLMPGKGDGMIRPATHQAIDYLVAIVLILAPFFFGFSAVISATWVAILSGVALGTYSVVTRYAAESPHPVGWRLHLALDAILGLFVAASPWIFGFSRFIGTVWMPHLVLGIVLVLAAAVSALVAEARVAPQGELGGHALPPNGRCPCQDDENV